MSAHRYAQLMVGAALLVLVAPLLADKATEAKIKALAAALDAKPDNARVRNELVRLCTVELDDPSRAATYLGDGVDAAFAKYVPAAAKGTDQAPELACMELGDWYRSLAGDASPKAKDAMLRRARAYYQRFLDLHEAENLKRSQATLALDKVNEALGKKPGSAAVAPAGSKLPTGQWVDLLAMVDIKKDCISPQPRGLWQRQGKTLVCLPPRFSTTDIALPVAVDGSYELQVKLIRRTVDGFVSVFLPVGSRTARVHLDNDSISGLRKPITRRSDPPDGMGKHLSFEANRVYTVDVRVTVQGDDVEITANIDGKPFVRWRCPQTKLGGSLQRMKGCVGLGAYRSTTIFGMARLRMIKGTAQAMRP